MYEYMKRFGFGTRSGVPLAAESPGLVWRLDRWGTTSLASVSMGQEVSATSIQLARAAAVIANGGLLVKPKLILARGGKPEPTEPPVRILKPETAITMRQMMEGVVLRGTGRRYCKLDGYTSGGKTGSAQIFDVANHHYTHTYNASFMGFAPVTNPALIVMVTLNGTVGEAGFGGPSAGPVFNRVATEALRILDVPRDLPENAPDKDNVTIAQNYEDAAIAGLGDSSILEEDPTATPKPTEAVLDDDGVEVTPAVLQGPVVPDFRGKTVREVIASASESGLPVMVEGSGIARLQLPAPGSVLMDGRKVRVQFRR
jgi:cell division protein FtsI (penicillin-binding protein 3)